MKGDKSALKNWMNCWLRKAAINQYGPCGDIAPMGYANFTQ
jgi:hypothetical protein